MAGFITRLLERRRMEREGQLGTRKRRTDSIWGEAADRSPVLTIALVVLLLGVCMTVLTLPELRQYPELVPNQLAPSTIFARVDFSYEDKAATALKREEATVMQPRYFRLSPAYNEDIFKRWEQLLSSIHERWKLEQEKKVYSSTNSTVGQETAALSIHAQPEPRESSHSPKTSFCGIPPATTKTVRTSQTFSQTSPIIRDTFSIYGVIPLSLKPIRTGISSREYATDSLPAKMYGLQQTSRFMIT